MKLIALSFLFLLASTGPADLVTQTDWSGGGGESGPVTDWGNLFDTSSSMDWFSLPGQLTLQVSIIEPEFAYLLNGGTWFYPEDVYPCDLDGDGEMDVLTCGWDRVVWFRNQGGASGWTVNTLPYFFMGTTDVNPADIDGNGTCDVVRANSSEGPGLRWYENYNGSGTSWIPHTITQACEVENACTSDIDGDGDLDVAFIQDLSDSVGWCENLDGYGLSWQRHACPPTGGSVNQYDLKTADLDGDGDLDFILATEDGVLWYENTDGTGTGMVPHPINLSETATSAASADIDGDGDLDVPFTRYTDTGWFENLDGTATDWTLHTVETGYGRFVAWPFDADSDGDIDLLTGGGGPCLQLNADGSGTSWTPVSLYWSGGGPAKHGRTADLDGDGLEDAVLSTYTLGFQQKIWWGRLSERADAGELTGSILDSGEDPLWGTLDWSENCPGGTDVTVDVRVGYTPGSMGSWTNFSTPGIALPAYMDHHPFLQYRVNLDRGTASSSPSLLDLTVTWNPTGTAEAPEAAVPGWSLSPTENPARGGALSVRFGAAEAGPVILCVYDLSGRMLAETELQAAEGLQNVSFPGLPVGLVVCTAAADGFSGGLRVVVLD